VDGRSSNWFKVKANLEGSVPTRSARCAESNGGARGAERERAKDFGVINSLLLLIGAIDAAL
jgi:hypothetical protein